MAAIPKRKASCGLLNCGQVLLGRKSNDEAMSIAYAAGDAAGGGFGPFMPMIIVRVIFGIVFMPIGKRKDRQIERGD